MKLNNLVKEIIEENSISKQTDIADILLKKYKISVTQSNISRILKQIKAVKVVSSNKEMVYEIQEKLSETFHWVKKLIKKIEDNGNLIVITSYPGAAHLVAQTLDEKNLKNILGTIAGVNNLIVVPRDVNIIEELKQEIEKALE